MVIVGLDNAGKTTLLGMLKDGCLRSTHPTFQPSTASLPFNGYVGGDPS
jgi:GTPase SAR1 family protein